MGASASATYVTTPLRGQSNKWSREHASSFLIYVAVACTASEWKAIRVARKNTIERERKNNAPPPQRGQESKFWSCSFRVCCMLMWHRRPCVLASVPAHRPIGDGTARMKVHYAQDTPHCFSFTAISVAFKITLAGRLTLACTEGGRDPCSTPPCPCTAAARGSPEGPILDPRHPLPPFSRPLPALPLSLPPRPPKTDSDGGQGRGGRALAAPCRL
jgi:hypothetical protein